VARVAEGLAGLRDPLSALGSPAERIWVDVESDRVRLTTYLTFAVEMVDRISALLVSAGEARAAIAEDNDEFGACWVVLAVEGGIARTVHRRYVLNADPRKRRDVKQALRDFVHDGQVQDPRADDVAGAQAATEAALLFGVEPGPVVNAETGSVTAFEELGVVGGPFPWREPMGLTWPGPEAGRAFAHGSRRRGRLDRHGLLRRHQDPEERVDQDLAARDDHEHQDEEKSRRPRGDAEALSQPRHHTAEDAPLSRSDEAVAGKALVDVVHHRCTSFVVVEGVSLVCPLCGLRIDRTIG
jgi:hypothetical protein